MKNYNSPYVFVIKKNTFEKYKYKSFVQSEFEMNREQAL